MVKSLQKPSERVGRSCANRGVFRRTTDFDSKVCYMISVHVKSGLLMICVKSHSRFDGLSSDLPDDTRQRLGAFSKIRELHLSDCSTTMKEVVLIISFLPNLRVLHLEANRTISTLLLDEQEYQILDRCKTLKELRLGGCPISRWDEIAAILEHLSG